VKEIQGHFGLGLNFFVCKIFPVQVFGSQNHLLHPCYSGWHSPVQSRLCPMTPYCNVTLKGSFFFFLLFFLSTESIACCAGK